MKANPTINSINLKGNKFTDEGIQHLARAICNTALEDISLANNKITDKCLEPTAAILRTNKTIQKLDLSGNGIVNRVAKNKMANTLTWVSV